MPPLVQIPRFVTIPVGTSFATFDIIPLGRSGFSGMSVNANGVIGSELDFETRSFLTQLSISTGSVVEPLVPGESIELKLYVDDQYMESIPGAALKIVPDKYGTVTPINIKTESDGSAKVYFTPSRDSKTVSLQIFANAEGYVENQKTLQFSVATDGSEGNGFAGGVPDWVIYIAIAVVVVIATVMFLFLKKPKQASEEEDELELFEDEDI
jgi:hypothetical protein